MADNDLKKCPKCDSPYGYPMSDQLWACPECGHEWSPSEMAAAEEAAEQAAEDALKVIDANGNELEDGDSVIVIKDLPVRGAPKPVKAGTRVKNIRVQPDGPDGHNISCRIDGFGAMALKSEFVRKQ